MLVKNEILTPNAIMAFNKLMGKSDQLPLLMVWDLSDVMRTLQAQHKELLAYLKTLSEKYPEDTPEKEAELQALIEREFDLPIKNKVILPNDFVGLGAADVEALSFLIERPTRGN